jgi:hypothetical protein
LHVCTAAHLPSDPHLPPLSHRVDTPRTFGGSPFVEASWASVVRKPDACNLENAFEIVLGG